MESNGSTNYFSIHPPRLEDAGLEEPALPMEGIQEAFHRAAEVVKSRMVGLVPDCAGKCIENSGPSHGEWEDAIVDASTALGEDHGKCVDSVTSGNTAQCKDLVNPPEHLIEDAILEGNDFGPELGEEGCVVGERDPRSHGYEANPS